MSVTRSILQIVSATLGVIDDNHNLNTAIDISMAKCKTTEKTTIYLPFCSMFFYLSLSPHKCYVNGMVVETNISPFFVFYENEDFIFQGMCLTSVELISLTQNQYDLT